MKTNSKHTFHDWREARRMRAWDLYQQGWSQKDIAAALGVSKGAVSQWITCAKTNGVAGLKARIAPGPTPKLSPAQCAQLPALLHRGAQAYGFPDAVWTCARVAALIAEEFGVQFHPDHVRRILRSIGWSRQKPTRRATQRDAAAIATWQEDRWPTIKKKAETEGRTIIWGDESAFYLLPAVVHTYAPRGQTPCLTAPCSRAHLSVISGITQDGRLLMQVHRHSIRSAQVIQFLRHLLRHVAGPITVIWDGATIHRSTEIRTFLTTPEAARLHLERLPAYAPDLNPDEGIWRHLKRVELRNTVSHSLDELAQRLRRAVARLRHKRHVLTGCLVHAGAV